MLEKVILSVFKKKCVKEYKFYPSRKWRFDHAIVEDKIAIETEGGVWTGGRHTRGKGFINDMEKYNTATAMGWKVFRIVPGDNAAVVKFLEMYYKEKSSRTLPPEDK